MTTTSTRWRAHGLTIASDPLALDLRPTTTDAAAPDVTFTVLPAGPVPAHGEQLPGRLLAHYDDRQGASLSVAERRSGAPEEPRREVDVCFHGVAVAAIDTATWGVGLRLAPDADPDLAAVLISGTLLSVVLTLRGHPVLHASAAVLGDRAAASAIAFVGQSGMGKSTMATLLCRDGGRLLTDDVLRTDLAPGGTVLAWPGATATRLRPSARALGVATAGSLTSTADERYSAALRLADDTAVRLEALVVPQPDRDHDHVAVDRVDGVRAVLTLASFPRILGWHDATTSGQALRHWGELVRRVPVLVARIPWGPPFADDLGTQVAEAVRRATGS